MKRKSLAMATQSIILYGAPVWEAAINHKKTNGPTHLQRISHSVVRITPFPRKFAQFLAEKGTYSASFLKF